MKTIWKYELKITDKQTIRIPHGAAVISTDVQNGKLCVWAGIPNTNAPLVDCHVMIIGTGNPMPENLDLYLDFVGTVQMPPFVWHVFILPNLGDFASEYPAPF